MMEKLFILTLKFFAIQTILQQQIVYGFAESYSFKNSTVVVTTRLGAPFCMLKESVRMLSGNERFEGYSIDVIEALSKISGFRYNISLVPDGAYGNRNENGKWNGLIGEILEGRADLAIADITITSERQKVVDFSPPIMYSGISILYSKPIMAETTDLFLLLHPLSPAVWISIIVAYLAVSFVLFILARFTEQDLSSPPPRDNNTDADSQYKLLNFMWFALGYNKFYSKSISSRIVTAVWWFFILIMVATYTANLVGQILTTRQVSVAPIQSVEDLAKQSKIKYGVVKHGSTAAFFKDSIYPTYQQMFRVMETSVPSVYVESNAEGIERVVEGKGYYAFIGESSSVEYVIERNCALTQIGGISYSKAYGIAMPLNSPYRQLINVAVLRLQENGDLENLKRKWWTEKRGGGSCHHGHDDTSESDWIPETLHLTNVGGIFIVLVFGIIIAAIVAVIELFLKSRKSGNAKRDNITL